VWERYSPEGWGGIRQPTHGPEHCKERSPIQFPSRSISSMIDSERLVSRPSEAPDE